MQKSNELLELISKLEHDQWMEWSKNISKSEKISKERLDRWKKDWVPYADLPEDVKEQDRVYARKVLEAIKSHLKKTKYKKAKPMSPRDWETHQSNINTNI